MSDSLLTLLSVPVLWSIMTMMVANLVSEKVSETIKSATKVIIWVLSFGSFSLGTVLTVTILELQGRIIGG